jgi:integrase
MKTVVFGDRGCTTIRVQRGFLYVGLPRQCSGGKQRSIATGLSDTTENREKVQNLQRIIDGDVERNDFDTTLERYKQKHRRSGAFPEAKGSGRKKKEEEKKPLTLVELYSEYCADRKLSTSPSTHKSIYQTNLTKFSQCPHQDPLEARKISAWLNSQFTSESSLRSLVQINAAVKWGMGLRIIIQGDNLYPTLINSVRGKGKKRKEIEYYSIEERDRIIYSAYEYGSKFAVNVAELCDLLFLTGLRWSEAIALDCGDWDGNSNKLTISKAVVEGVNGMEVKEGLKREDKRVIPVVPKAVALLDRITTGRTGLMFPSQSGGYLNLKNYSARFWKPLLQYVCENHKQVPIYTLYSARRTFISLALKSGYAVEDVANLAGNSPLVIYQNYAGVTKNLELTDFSGKVN